MVFVNYGLSPLVVDMLLSDVSPYASCASARKSARKQPQRHIPVDVLEKDSVFEIVADVPGVQKDAIHLDIDRGTVTLSVSQPSDAQATPSPSVPDVEAPAAGDGNTPSEPPAAMEAGEQPDASLEVPAQPKVLRRERAGRFAKRALKLPETADLGQARAECVAGVLTVTVPKRALPSPQRIPIA